MGVVISTLFSLFSTDRVENSSFRTSYFERIKQYYCQYSIGDNNVCVCVWLALELLEVTFSSNTEIH